MDNADATAPRLVSLRAVLGSRPQVAIRATALAIVLSAVWVLSGCDGGSSPRTLPRLSGAAAGRSHRALVAPRSTVAARPRSERASVIAVVRRYFRVVNRLSHDMNAVGLAAMFTATCPCRAQVRAVRSAAGKAEHFVGTAHVNVVRPSVEGPTRASVLVNFDVSRSGVVTAGGAMVTSVPARPGLQRIFRLENDGGRWLVYRIDAA